MASLKALVLGQYAESPRAFEQAKDLQCLRRRRIRQPNSELKESKQEMEENGDDKSSLTSSPNEEEEESPVRAVVCLKSKEEIKRFEETEDCFILDFDPSESPELSNISMEENVDAVDVSVVAEKGPVACRDYPHSRDLCLKFPFTTTPHESYCEMCYCYVCDSAAPCKYWTQPIAQHCDADGAGHWKDLRQATKKVAAKQEANNFFTLLKKRL